MKLIIFPGAGNPEHPRYKKVYSLIDTLAHHNGFTLVDSSIRWPGHFTPPDSGKGELSLPDCTEKAARILSEYEARGEPYSVLARSFGIFVILRTLQQVKVSCLARVVLWGPPPFWRCWNGFLRQRDDFVAKGLERWARINGRFFETIQPIEFLLQTVCVETVVATGMNDEYCNPDFLDYLRKVCSGNSRVKFASPVPEAAHEVTAEASESTLGAYERALFVSPA